MPKFIKIKEYEKFRKEMMSNKRQGGGKGDSVQKHWYQVLEVCF
jgi:hypothetical protein